MHACASKCILICAHACFRVLMHVHECRNMLKHAHACLRILTQANTWFCILMHVHACFCIHIHVSCMFMHVYACLCMLMHADAGLCMFLHTYACSCVFQEHGETMFRYPLISAQPCTSGNLMWLVLSRSCCEAPLGHQKLATRAFQAAFSRIWGTFFGSVPRSMSA